MEVKLEVRLGYVFGDVSGPVSLVDGLRIMREVFDFAAVHDLRFILLDFYKQEGILPTHDKFEVGERAAEYAGKRPFEKKLKVAMVAPSTIADGFAALAASNRGLNTKVFSDIPQALDWLGIVPDDLKRSG